MIVGRINEVVLLTGYFYWKCLSVTPGPKKLAAITRSMVVLMKRSYGGVPLYILFTE